jgi:hypothetical protein
MLGIKDKTGRWREWHVGDSIPELHGQVITFQADGHELEMILIAMGMVFTYKGTLTQYRPSKTKQKIECQICYDEDGSYKCIRPLHQESK